MGIKDVWNILQPYCERKSIFALENKTVAIDLAGWVCQAQNIAEYQVQPKLYLRNLYFRTCFLLLHDVRMIFVLEGAAPKLKLKTISNRRNNIHFKGDEPRKNYQSNEIKGRSRFNSILKQCKEMLTLMGLACVTAEGEAEAMCACLNQKGIVEGCISQDSDCFAYGAHIVYRNFSISMQGNQTGAGGSIDVYDLRRAQTEMGFGRNKVIAMALFCGSDYNDGVVGIGKESALQLFENIPDNAILERIHSWKSKNSYYVNLNQKLNDRNICSNCFHNGKKGMHAKKGCYECKTREGCTIDERLSAQRHECHLRQKALLCEDFPCQELIDEFLQSTVLPKVDFHWKMPDLIGFIDFTRKHLQWMEIYALEKFMPILTRWVINYPHSKDAITSPAYIKKARVPKGIQSYEIVWKYDQLLPLIPKEQLEESKDMIKVFSTIEPQELINQTFPALVEAFEATKAKPKTVKAKKQKLNPALNTKATKEDSLCCDDDGADLSLIIEEIVNHGVPVMFQKKINTMLEEQQEGQSDSDASEKDDEYDVDEFHVSSIFQSKIDNLLYDQSVQELSFIDLTT